jgi:hypothetical protein
VNVCYFIVVWSCIKQQSTGAVANMVLHVSDASGRIK